MSSKSQECIHTLTLSAYPSYSFPRFSAGKTALAEWMLYDEHMLTKEPNSGGALSLDADPVESSRHSSVFSHFLRVPHGGGGGGNEPSYLLQVTDTPWGDFPSDAVAALNGVDGAVVVVSAADGVQAGTIHALEHCQQAGIPTMICLSKMDRPFTKVDSVLQDLQSTLNGKVQPVPLQVAVMGENEALFQGVVPLLVLGDNGVVQRNPNAELDEGLQEAWMVLEEAVAMTDDDLLVEYLENGKLQTQQVLDGLHSAVRRQQEHGVSSSTTILPLVYTAAEQNLGVLELMDAMVAVLPNPVEMRETALQVACQSQGICDRQPGVEAGFAARVLHTTMDSFGSLTVLRIISNSQTPGTATFDSLPHEAVVLRTGEKIRLPSISTSVGLCGKERLPLAENSPVMPGDVIALPKLSDAVQTNDILTALHAVQEEEEEIVMETESHNLTPLSRPPEHVPLMTCATISLADSAGNGKKSKSSGGGAGGDDKLISALTSLARQDLAVRIEHDVSGKLLLRCMSTDHQKVLVQRLQDRYGLRVELGKPSVQYRETLAKTVRNVEGRHKKQSGGSGQFGVCYISMDPLDEGAGIEFESQVKGGAINKAFISSVEKGVREQLQLGGPLGYPVTDVKVIVTDGKMHSVDSKDVAFQSAGKLAVKAALEKGGTRLLQPMEKVVFVIEEKLQGDINTIVTRGNGYVTSTNPSSSIDGDSTKLEVEAIIPTATIGEVSDVLRAASGGEAQYTSEFSHYSVVPESDVDAILIGRDGDDTHLHP
jgi:elongation factor G